MPTCRMEQRLEDGLLERILAYEGQAVRVLDGQIQTFSARNGIPGLTFRAGLNQSKSARIGPDTPIRLAEQKKVPRYYSSMFELAVYAGGDRLAEPCPDGTMSLFSAFTPVVCANRGEVLWYDYSADFAQALAGLADRIARAFPNGFI